MSPAVTPSVALLLVAEDDVEALGAQLEALVAADLPDDAEVVITADCASAPVRSLLARLEGDVVVRALPARVGRRAALAEAATAATADVAIALGPLTLPEPGFVAPLVAAVRAGAGIAGPTVVTSAGAHAGLRLLGDRSVAPGGTDALPLDCIAAPRELFRFLPEWHDRGQDLWEVTLAERAASWGPVAVAPEARVRRPAAALPASIVLCTQNREDEIGPCIDALVADGALASGGEILVVDNASTDGTAAAAHAARERHGDGVRVISEPVPGLSRARRTGAAEARYDVLVYFDDDARPAPGWFDHLMHAFGDAGVAVAGGPISGLWPQGSEHAAFPHVALGFFSVLQLVDTDFDLDAPNSPYGANYAIRRSALEAVGGFDDRFGASAGRRLGGEETLVSQQIQSRRLGRVRYVAGAAIGHRIPQERAADAGYALIRAYRWGAETIWHEEALKGTTEAGLRTHLAAINELLDVSVTWPGRLDCDAAFRLIAEAPDEMPRRIFALKALGEVAVCTHLLGLSEVRLPSGTVLTVDERHANGFVAAAHPVGDPGARPVPAGELDGDLPKVSCIIPAYNMAAYLGAAIDSALAQDYPAGKLEVIVIDDGSTDATPEVCARYGDRIRAIRQENQGVVVAVERGMREATGELLAFLDADDEWLPHKTRLQAERFRERPEVGLVFGDFEVMDGDGRPIHGSLWNRTGLFPTRTTSAFGRLVAANFVQTGTLVVRASLLDAICPMPKDAPWQDWAVAVAAARVAPIDHVAVPLFRYRIHGANAWASEDPEANARALAKDLRFRRATIESLQAGEVEPIDLRDASHLLCMNLLQLANATGKPVHELLDRDAATLDRAISHHEAGRAAAAAGALDAAAVHFAHAIAADPARQEALRWLDAVVARLLRRRSDVPDGPLPELPSEQTAKGALGAVAARPLIVLADELAGTPDLVAGYADAFGDAPLVIYAPDPLSDDEVARLEHAVDASGVAAAGIDVAVLATPGARAVERHLAETARGLLTRRAHATSLATLTPLDAATASPITALAA